MRIYIDTSVINGLYSSEFKIRVATKKFLEFVQKTGSILYSADLIVEEIERTPSDSRRNELKDALSDYEVEFLAVTDEVQMIAKTYIREKIIPVLVSWNFEHIVKLKTKVEIDRINRQYGYPQIAICSPEEV